MLNPRSDFLAHNVDVMPEFGVTTSVGSSSTVYLNADGIDMGEYSQAVFFGLIDTTTSHMSMTIHAQDSDNGTTWANASNDDVEVSATLADGTAGTLVCSYVGNKRYVRGFLEMINSNASAQTVKATIISAGYRKIARVG